MAHNQKSFFKNVWNNTLKKGRANSFSTLKKENISTEKAIKTGTLSKEGGSFKSWKERNFKLVSNGLEYYKPSKNSKVPICLC